MSHSPDPIAGVGREARLPTLSLRLDSHGLIARPRQASSGTPTEFPLPKIPARVFHRCIEQTLALWQQYRRSWVVLLFVNPTQATWIEVVPYQQCSQDDARADLSQLDTARSLPGWILAGTWWAIGELAPDVLISRVPAFDGTHFFMTPQWGWPTIRCFNRTGGEPLSMALSGVVGTEPDVGLDHMLGRIEFLDHL